MVILVHLFQPPLWLLAAKNSAKNDWIINSGASHHMTHDVSLFKRLDRRKNYDKKIYVGAIVR
jgi:hypothetical protein